MAAILLEHGVDVNARGMWQETALHVAANNGFGEMVQLLLANGASVNPVNGFGSTPYASDSHKGHQSTVTLLRPAGGR